MSEPMTKEELIKKIKEVYQDYDQEEGHIKIDVLLLEYIDGKPKGEIYELFYQETKWYA